MMFIFRSKWNIRRTSFLHWTIIRTRYSFSSREITCKNCSLCNMTKMWRKSMLSRWKSSAKLTKEKTRLMPNATSLSKWSGQITSKLLLKPKHKVSPQKTLQSLRHTLISRRCWPITRLTWSWRALRQDSKLQKTSRLHSSRKLSLKSIMRITWMAQDVTPRKWSWKIRWWMSHRMATS